MSNEQSYEWIDWPEEGFMGGEWDWGHTIGCAIAAFFYVIPGIIFLIWKPIARQKYLERHEEAKKNHEIAFQRTNNDYIFSALHLGGHPRLPFQRRILIGLRGKAMIFYNYNLKELHSVPLSNIEIGIKTTQNVSGGPSYVSTTNTHTLRLRDSVNNKVFEAELDFKPTYTPQQFIQKVNELLVE